MGTKLIPFIRLPWPGAQALLTAGAPLGHNPVMPSDDTPSDPDPAPDSQDSPMVGQAESGQKILQFLQRRLNLPPTLLHRWIRTGQVRLNGGRCKPFVRVKTGDVVRLPLP